MAKSRKCSFSGAFILGAFRLYMRKEERERKRTAIGTMGEPRENLRGEMRRGLAIKEVEDRSLEVQKIYT